MRNRSVKVLLENFFALSTLQITSYVFPLITFPYLTLHLGIEGFGTYVFIQAVYTYLEVIISYGFKVTATESVAKHNRNKIKLSKIFYSVIFIKSALLVLIIFVFLFLYIFIPYVSANIFLFLMGIPYLLGKILFPIWFYQGIQKMKFITIIQTITKLFFTGSIFFFVNDSNDVFAALLLHSTGVFLAGLFAFLLAINKFKISLPIIHISEIIREIHSGFYVFIAQFSVSMYTTINTLLLGAFTNPMTVGVYALAEKVFKIITSLGTPVSRSLFPFLAENFNRHFSKYKRYVFLGLIILISTFSVLAGFTYTFSGDIISLIISGNIEELQSVECLKILSFGIPFYPLGAFFTYLLVIQNEKKSLLKIVSAIVLINTMLAAPAIYYFGVSGLSVVTVIISICVAVTKGIYSYKSMVRFENDTVLT